MPPCNEYKPGGFYSPQTHWSRCLGEWVRRGFQDRGASSEEALFLEGTTPESGCVCACSGALEMVLLSAINIYALAKGNQKDRPLPPRAVPSRFCQRKRRCQGGRGKAKCANERPFGKKKRLDLYPALHYPKVSQSGFPFPSP
ncbi:UNVERIFIED_CONTAM: hypothetical protein K2H54_002023 [Gekko kuhli]